MKSHAIILILALMLIIGCSDNTPTATTTQSTGSAISSDKTLPAKFTIHVSTDETSSAAARLYDSYVSFEGNKITSGKRTSDIKGMIGAYNGRRYCEEVLDISTNEWKNIKWEEPSAEANPVPQPCLGDYSSKKMTFLTREELISAINSKNITPKEEGCWHKYCYEIIELSPDKIILPEKFTLHVNIDGTSSGANRLWDSYISFDGDKVTSGKRTRETLGMNGKNQCEEILDINTNIWKNTIWQGPMVEETPNPGPCLLADYEPKMTFLTRKDITEAIDYGIITPKEQGCHYRACYEII